jgi:hypothetical protein
MLDNEQAISLIKKIPTPLTTGTAWIGLIAVIAIVFWSILSPKFGQLIELEDRYAVRSGLLVSLEALPKRESLIKERLERLNREAAEQYLYAGEVNAIQSLIQRDIRIIANASQLQIASIRSLSNPNSNKLIGEVVLQMGFITTYAELLPFLSKLEAQKPILRVRKLSVRVNRPSDDYSPARLQVVAEVSGYHAFKVRAKS